MWRSFVLLILFVPFVAKTSVLSRSGFGDPIFWSSSNSSISFFVDPTNDNLDFSDSTSLLGILSQATNQWNQRGGMPLGVVGLGTGAISNRNDIYFSNNPFLFSGSGVLAVTQVSFVSSTGEIVETDIILNDSVTFTNDPSDTSNGVNSTVYLGDVATHEFGHTLGISHSLTEDSSMIFTAYKGQFTVSEEDLAGKYSSYANGGNFGNLTGTIVGGSSSAPINVFGAHIQAISQTTGSVTGSAVTDENGSFVLGGLPLNDHYFLYISPANNSANLPNYYNTLQKNFCVGGNYRGRFYESCQSQDRGFPVGVELTSSNLDLGKISIGCDLKVSSDYIQNKGTAVSIPVEFDGNFGNTFVGFFTTTEVANATPDIFKIDLTNFVVPDSTYRAEIKFVSQGLFSELATVMNISNGVTNQDYPDTLGNLQDGVNWLFEANDKNKQLDYVARFNLSTIASDNLLTLTVTPFDLSTLTNYSSDDFLPASSVFKDPVRFYMLIITIVREVGGEITTESSRKYPTRTDNSTCVKASNTYRVKAFATSKNDVLLDKDRQESQVGCGTVEFDSGSGGPNGLGVVLGFILSIILASVRRIWSVLQV